MRFSSRPVSRPVSSPGRTETYPPLLMRFLRTNANSRSRSRSRSRSKPIFFRRKTATSATETQEPSSPKVTCMGQVRINRSKKPKPGNAPKPPQRRSKWVKNTFLCYPFSGKIKPNCFSPVWRKWKSFSHVSFSRKSEKISNSSRSEPIFNRSTVDPEEHNILPRKTQESFTATPPRNALLLTRCRSAPYRSSSLDYINGEIKEDDDNAAASPPSGNVSASGESMEESEEAKRHSFEDFRERVVLTRCKSEPARLGERLVTDMCYRQNGRLGFT